MSFFIPKPCKDCGSAPVYHSLEKLSVISDAVIAPMVAPLNALWRTLWTPLWPYAEQAMPALVWLLVKLRFGTRVVAPDMRTTGRARVLWEEAGRRGITMEEFRLFNLPGELFVARFHFQVRAFQGLPRPHGKRAKSLAWMDDKSIMRQTFAAAGIPVAAGGVCRTEKQAYDLFEMLDKPVITKPNLGSRSRHTTVHILTTEEFVRGFAKAKQLSPWVVVEEELVGFVHRATLIGGRLIAVCRREPAYVVADGVHKVAELLDLENKKPARQGPLFHTIAITPEVHAELQHQGLTMQSIPAQGKLICMGQKTSRGAGGGITDVTDTVHADNRTLFEDIGILLKDPLVGIDCIMQDMSKSWRDQKRCGIIECNSLPFIDLHHYPLVGKSRNVAGALWDIIFPPPILAKTA